MQFCVSSMDPCTVQDHCSPICNHLLQIKAFTFPFSNVCVFILCGNAFLVIKYQLQVVM